MKKFQTLLCLASAVFLSATAAAQNSIQQFTADSIDLQMVVKTIIETHPSVLKAQEAIHSVEATIGLAKAALYPNIDLGAGYTRIGPVPEITIPNMGSFQMAPNNNYNATVDIRQTVYDFKKTDKNIAYASSGKEIAATNINIVKQKLTTLAIVTYYNLAYLQESINIKDKQLGILEQHLDFINRKKETGSATDYEILSTKVRISAAKNQKMDLETALGNQLAALNSLLGFPESTKIKVKNNLVIMPVNTRVDSLINYAVNHRSEMILAGFREKQAEIKLQSLKIENNPVISAFASGGIKNGYFPELNNPKANYAAGLGIKVPLYTATRHRNLLMMASTDINSIKLDIEQNRREISTEVFQNAATLESCMRKIDQSELQLEQSEEARRLADLSFKAGTLTNLDLLDSESLEAESRLNLMRAKIDYMISLAKLDISIGKQGY